MGKRAAGIYAIFSILFFLIYAGWMGKRIYQRYKTNIHLAKMDVRGFNSIVGKNYIKSGNFSSPEFDHNIRNAISSRRFVETIVVRDISTGKTIYSSTKIGKKGREIISLLLEKRWVRNLEQFKNISLETTCVILNKKEIDLFLRDSIIVISGFIIFTVLVIIFSKSAGSNSSPGKMRPKASGKSEGFSREKVKSSNSVGDSLYDKLSIELRRSAELRQDVVFLLIKLSKLKNDYSIDIRSEIVKLFDFPNFNFNFGSSVIGVIIPDFNLDQAVKELNKIKDVVVKDYSNIRISVGISARNNRDIDSNYLFKETYASLKRAASEKDNAIIAFVSDPVKYNQYRSSGH